MKTLSLISLLFIFIGCGSTTQSDRTVLEDTAAIDTFAPDGTLTDTSENTSDSEPIPIKLPENRKEIKVFKGLYSSGNEVSTFRDCGGTKVYWLEDESKKLAPAYKKTQGFLAYPYESVYVELKGYLKGKSSTGYAGEYENVISVTDVITIKQKNFNSGCFDYEFIALGNEPFWSVDIIPLEKIIAFKDVAGEKSYVFPYTSPQVSGNTSSYELTNDRGQKMRVFIKKEPCSDGMSDRKYYYSAQVTLGQKVLKGCAIKKGDKFPMDK